MLRTFAERWFRKRFTFPVLVLVAGGLLALSEMGYVSTAGTVEAEVRRAETHSAVSRLLQLLTNVESAHRAYLLSEQQVDRTFYTDSRNALAQSRHTVIADLERSGVDGARRSQQLDHQIEALLEETSAAVSLVESDQLALARSLDRQARVRDLMKGLRDTLGSQLLQLGAMQRDSRATLYNGIRANRIGVGALAVLSVLGLFVFMRQIEVQDAERDHQQGLLSKEQLRLEEEVRSRTAALHELAQHLQTAREDERAHLARELHDELGGLLTAMKLDVARMRAMVDELPQAKARLEHLVSSLNQGIAFKRRIIEDLRPSALADLGLRVSVQALCDDMANRLDIPVHTQLSDVHLGPEADLAVYRFVQEALTNIGKHANAHSVKVRLASQGDQAVVEVEDDGEGFDLTASRHGHHGLVGMRFRAESLGGQMGISSQPGQGTRLRASFPLPERPTHSRTSPSPLASR